VFLDYPAAWKLQLVSLEARVCLPIASEIPASEEFVWQLEFPQVSG